MTSISYFGKMNSTHGSVVPLAMFVFYLVILVHLCSSLFNFICLHFSPLLGGTGLRWSLKVDSDQPYACLVHSELYVGRDGNGWDGIDGWSS